jgi:hypothetical protein
MTTKIERYRRIALLERAIAETGWSLQLKRALAAEFGVTTRTIEHYKAEMIAGYQKEMDEADWEAQRADFIGRLRGHQRVALAQGKLGPLAAMLNLESRIIGVDLPSGGEVAGIVLVTPRVDT